MGIGGDDEPQKCVTIVHFHSLLVSLHLIVASPLCPLAQFTNHESGAVKCCHSAATACLGILKEGSGNVLVTQSLCCVCVFFIEL